MTPAEAKDVGGKLIHLLSQQRLLYRQLKELAQKQSSLVDGNDPETLLRVLAGRQRLIDKLSAIGLTPRKSLTIGALKVPLGGFGDFFRGVIDGDGNIRHWLHPTNGRQQWYNRDS